MRQPETILPHGTKVRTHDVLGPTTGMIISPASLAMRKPGAVGTIHGIVGGHGGDVYWVQHDGDMSPAAPYCFYEFELAT